MVYLLRILVISVFVCGGGNAAIAKDATTILMFGDSITAGYGLKAKDAPPAQLEAQLKQQGKEVTVINGGVSGDTTAAGRSRLSWTLDKHAPDLVILALGGNDVLRGINPSITRENLNSMLLMLKERNIPVILSAVDAPVNLGVDYRAAFKQTYEELADEYDAALYPFLLADTYGNPALMQRDGIHPSEAGATVIAQKLAQYLIEEYELDE